MEGVNSTVGAAVYREDGIRIYGLDAELELKVFFFLIYFILILFCSLFFLNFFFSIVWESFFSQLNYFFSRRVLIVMYIMSKQLESG